ncbi:lytic transglycosylase domain-containing protein [Sphingomonas sp.]|uniref:lytic transglycosylase domain-containing protein n=1 Tax=Sphingomonas sp. TaxID=28214 RepID=UPI001DA03412|nr:lytic transglycosylase domain-containing protein [Sphingomonas sp.]MBX9795622.1 lytic transglycosylase domain-containing protein [Sphingomonas sp.]
MKALLAIAAVAGLVPAAALARDGEARSTSAAAQREASAGILTTDQRTAYAGIFASIRAGKWVEARLQLASMERGPLHSVALAEILAGKGSPRATAEDLAKLLADAPELPQAEQIARLARARGAETVPELPYVRALSWQRGAPVRRRAQAVRSDVIAADLAARMQPLVKEDRAAEAQALLEATPGLSPEATTEWQSRVAWIYYLTGDLANARAMAAKAVAGSGDWAVQGEWITGLAAWRAHDYAESEAAFSRAAARTGDVELRSAALFWGARADMAGGKPERVETKLKSAAQYDETFYGLLARQSLGLVASAETARGAAADWSLLTKRANIRAAAALIEIGEEKLADDLIRHQARIGDVAEFPALVRLAGALDRPALQFWLAHNAPAGAQAPTDGRYPLPSWTPDGGWRVDKALVFAHALQESSFRVDVVSPAGAYGLMQLRPAAAADIARGRGIRTDRAALTRPQTNIEIGQSYLELLRDRPETGGLLPKVIAAYNAGPTPVEAWNAQVHDGGDPLLYIESIPYWETRGYVVTVLRNYWIYERASGRTASPSRAALAQGLWPRFPGMGGAAAVRMTDSKRPVETASAD